jgi:hypothetical protein
LPLRARSFRSRRKFDGKIESDTVGEEVTVTRVQEIAEQLRTLSGDELRELRAWLDDYENQAWDQQFEAEVAAGQWDALAEKALQDHREGRSTQL